LYFSGNNNINGNVIKDNYYGAALYKSTSNNISGNTIITNEDGIYILSSNYNLINGNNIDDNYYGVYNYHSSNNNITGNNVMSNWVGVYLYDTNNNLITANNITLNGARITYYNSISTDISGNSFNENWLSDTSIIDDGDMILATTIYTCGPAALATVLKNLGIYTTEAELAELAGTDETGTSLYGLKIATQAKGVTAVATRLTIDQLAANYIVVLSINGYNHFEVVQNITSSTVYLFDPNLGNIEMSRNKFLEVYSGVALVLNGTLPPGAISLTDDEMKDIKGMWYWATKKHSYWVPGYFTKTYHTISYTVSIPYIYFTWVSVYNWGPIHIGYWWFHIGWWHYHFSYTYAIYHYHPGHLVSYYTREKVYVLNMGKVKTVLYSSAGIIGGVVGIALSGIGEVFSGGTLTPAMVVTGGFSAVGIAGGIDGIYYSWNDPWYT